MPPVIFTGTVFGLLQSFGLATPTQFSPEPGIPLLFIIAQIPSQIISSCLQNNTDTTLQ